MLVQQDGAISKTFKNTEKQRIMKAFKKTYFTVAALLFGCCLTACEDANEYEDAHTNNPAWAGDYSESKEYTHPESLANTYWVRGKGMKFNAYGEEIQGYVESIDFIDESSVVVKMSQGVLPSSMKNTATWLDDSNTSAIPQYEYKYSSVTGNIEILKQVKDDKGKVSKVTIFIGRAVKGSSRVVITISHFGDTPVQTYLVSGKKPAN